MNNNKGLWIGGIAFIVIVALGLWWFAVPGSSGTFFDFAGLNRSSEKGAANPSVMSESRTSSTVASIAMNIEDAATFGSWLSSTGVAAQLTGKGPYTIFVPTDSAIGELKPGTFGNLSAAEKKRFVQYHVVSGRALDVDAMLSGTIQALSKDMLNFSNTNNIPMVNSGIVITQYKGSNGIVYLINAALVPPQKNPVF